MDWFCAVWNSDKVSSAVGAQILYDMLCEGDNSLVGDISLINEFCEDLLSKELDVKIAQGKGFVIVACNLEDAEMLHELVQTMAKNHGLSYFEPQNMTYVF